MLKKLAFVLICLPATSFAPASRQLLEYGREFVATAIRVYFQGERSVNSKQYSVVRITEYRILFTVYCFTDYASFLRFAIFMIKTNITGTTNIASELAATIPPATVQPMVLRA
jgi:hypothetical protein